MVNIKVGVVQASVEAYAVEKNLQKYSQYLQALKEQQVELAVLPEFFATGNTLESKLLKVAIETSQIVDEWLASESKKLQITIAGAYLSLHESDVYNTLVIQEPDQQKKYHIKTHAPPVEAIYYAVKNNHNIVDTRFGKIALIICAEMLYPEIVLADYRDCSMIIIVFAIPHFLPTIPQKLINVPQQLANANGIPVVLCSMAGDFVSSGSVLSPMPFKIKSKYCGKSGIYLPHQIVAGPASKEQQILVADIPLGPNTSQPVDTFIERGLPVFMQIYDLLFGRLACKIYQKNVKRYLGNLVENIRTK